MNASWRRIARALFLGFILAGQGRLVFHNHVSVPRARPGASVDSRRSASDADSEAACPICALAAQAKCAHVAAPAAVQAPSQIFAVAVLPETAASSSSLIRLSARAPPAC